MLNTIFLRTGQLGPAPGLFAGCMVFLGLAVGSCHGGKAPTVTLGEGTTYRNGTDYSQRVALPDGSQVLLRPGTEIGTAKGYGRENRDVELDGEAMFEVRSAGGRTFVLRTRNLEITVLGTRFRVDAFRKSAGEEVDLLEGRLRVKKTYHSDTDNAPEELTDGEMVMINRDIDLMEKEKLSPAELEKVKAMK